MSRVTRGTVFTCASGLGFFGSGFFSVATATSESSKGGLTRPYAWPSSALDGVGGTDIDFGLGARLAMIAVENIVHVPGSGIRGAGGEVGSNLRADEFAGAGQIHVDLEGAGFSRAAGVTSRDDDCSTRITAVGNAIGRAN